MLRMAAVSEGEDAGSPVLGIVASLSDITRQYDLQQTKNDVMALVSHEMRTPLSAIQGMSELLAQYDLDAGRRREMNLAINDEVKRLTRMITEYLDITRLESGATVLRRRRCAWNRWWSAACCCSIRWPGRRACAWCASSMRSRPAVLADPDLLARRGGEPGFERDQVQPGGNRSHCRGARGAGRRGHRGGGPGAGHSGRPTWTAFSRNSIACRGWRTPIRRARAWAWRWCAKSPNCTAAR